jgi:hypothetical protein
MMGKLAAAALAVGGICGIASQRQKSADTLRVCWRDQINDVDPYYNSLRTGLVVAHAWDGLVYRDPDGYVMKPLIAKSWKWIDPTTLEFELRSDRTFHNGDESASGVVHHQDAHRPEIRHIDAINYAWIAGAEEVSTHVASKPKAPSRPRSNTSPSSPIIHPYREKVAARPQTRADRRGPTITKSTASARSTWSGSTVPPRQRQDQARHSQAHHQAGERRTAGSPACSAARPTGSGNTARPVRQGQNHAH